MKADTCRLAHPRIASKAAVGIRGGFRPLTSSLAPAASAGKHMKPPSRKRRDSQPFRGGSFDTLSGEPSWPAPSTILLMDPAIRLSSCRQYTPPGDQQKTNRDTRLFFPPLVLSPAPVSPARRSLQLAGDQTKKWRRAFFSYDYSRKDLQSNCRVVHAVWRDHSNVRK